MNALDLLIMTNEKRVFCVAVLYLGKGDNAARFIQCGAKDNKKWIISNGIRTILPILLIFAVFHPLL